MDDSHREILKKYWEHLRKDLHPNRILPFLVKKKTLDEYDVQRLRALNNRVEQVDLLVMEILPTKGPEAFPHFIGSLLEIESHLAAILQQGVELQKQNESLSAERCSSAELRKEISSLKDQVRLLEHNREETGIAEPTERRDTQELEMEPTTRGLAENIEQEWQHLGTRQAKECKKVCRCGRGSFGDVSARIQILTEVQSRIQKLLKEAAEENAIILPEGTLGNSEEEFQRAGTSGETLNEASSQNEAFRSQVCIDCIQAQEKYSALELREGELKKELKSLEEERRDEKRKLESKIKKKEEKWMKEIEKEKNARKKLQTKTTELNKKIGALEATNAELREVANKNNEETENALQKQEKELREREENREKLIRELRAYQEVVCGLKEKLSRQQTFPGKAFTFETDFDRHGVLYYLRSCVTVTRSSEGCGQASDLLKREKATVSATEAKPGSWWRVDLGEEYVLFLTRYTLRDGSSESTALIRNWQLQGSLDGCQWKRLKDHKSDDGINGHDHFSTCSWNVDNETSAMRYFRIFQTGKNHSGKYGLHLSGLELYGVLLELKDWKCD